MHPPMFTAYKSRLNEIVQRYKLEHPRYECLSVSGPSHMPHIQMECVLKFNGQEHRFLGSGTSRKAAENDAAKVAIEFLEKGERPSPQRNPPPEDSRHVVVKVDQVQENWKGRLQELCQRRGWAFPQFLCETEGPQHNLRFYGVCIVERDRFTTHPQHFPTRKDAEQRAAALAFEGLTKSLRYFEQYRPNPKGDLAQLFLALFEKEVEYEVLEETGPPHMKVWRVALEVPDGTGTVFQSMTYSRKKDAEIDVASQALKYLNNLAPSTPSSKLLIDKMSKMNLNADAPVFTPPTSAAPSSPEAPVDNTRPVLSVGSNGHVDLDAYLAQKKAARGGYHSRGGGGQGRGAPEGGYAGQGRSPTTPRVDREFDSHGYAQEEGPRRPLHQRGFLRSGPYIRSPDDEGRPANLVRNQGARVTPGEGEAYRSSRERPTYPSAPHFYRPEGERARPKGPPSASFGGAVDPLPPSSTSDYGDYPFEAEDYRADGDPSYDEDDYEFEGYGYEAAPYDPRYDRRPRDPYAYPSLSEYPPYAGAPRRQGGPAPGTAREHMGDPRDPRDRGHEQTYRRDPPRDPRGRGWKPEGPVAPPLREGAPRPRIYAPNPGVGSASGSFPSEPRVWSRAYADRPSSDRAYPPPQPRASPQYYDEWRDEGADPSAEAFGDRSPRSAVPPYAPHPPLPGARDRPSRDRHGPYDEPMDSKAGRGVDSFAKATLNAPEYKLFSPGALVAPPVAVEVKKPSPERKQPTTPIGVPPPDLPKSSPSPFSLKSSNFEDEDEDYDWQFDPKLHDVLGDGDEEAY